MALRFRLLVFVSSFLLFSVELLLGRMVLPSFGSGAQVWTTCLVFYQAALLLGYLYAERAQRWITQARYRKWHLVVALVPLLALPFRLVHLEVAPVLGVSVALLLSAGLPFFALSTTSVVAQAWFVQTDHPLRDDPYFLYGTSNAGALAALLLYPFALEPALDLHALRLGWYAGYGIFIALVALCLPPVRPPGLEPETAAERPDASTHLVWLLLSAGASALLLACTNAVTLDAAVPLVWTLPLTAFLLTLVLCFGRKPLGERAALGLSLAGLSAASVALWALAQGKSVQGAVTVLHLCVLFVGCLLLHRALARAKPTSIGQLGTYYRDLALGGCVGGVLVGIAAPLLFRHLAFPSMDYVLALALILPGLLMRDRRALGAWTRARPVRFAAVLTVLLALGGVGVGAVAVAVHSRVEGIRTFYGLYTVTDKAGLRWFRNGNTLHGVANLGQGQVDEPLAYYHHDSPIGRLLLTRARAPRRVGVVGLGAGTLATYAEKGAAWDFYELDPEVIRIAQDDFHFLKDSPGQVRLIAGDARLTLEGAPDGGYDLLVLDAFSSDFVPLQLITVEAVRLYARKLAPGGMIAFHISNRLFALGPELRRIAHALGMSAAVGVGAQPPGQGSEPERFASIWVLLAKDPATLTRAETAAGFRALKSAPRGGRRPWSDEYVNLLRAIR